MVGDVKSERRYIEVLKSTVRPKFERIVIKEKIVGMMCGNNFTLELHRNYLTFFSLKFIFSLHSRKNE